MAITIRILNQTTTPPNPSGNTFISATFAIQNDAISGTWYKWSRSGIPSNTADVLAFLQAENGVLYTDAQAGGVTLTQAQVNASNYAWQHWDNRDTFAGASYTLEIGMFQLGTSPTVGAYRTMLNGVLTTLVPLVGTDFETHFNNKRASAGLAGAVGGFSLTQCDQFDNLLRSWLSARRADVLWAKSIVGLS